MSRCDAEMCSAWTGDGCLCAAMDGDLDNPEAQQFLDALDELERDARAAAEETP